MHPGTGKVCVPIDTKKVEAFDPLGVPTVTQLLGEIDRWDAEMKEPEREEEMKRVPDYEKTSLKPVVDYFKSFVASLLKAEQGVKRERDDDDPMEF